MSKGAQAASAGIQRIGGAAAGMAGKAGPAISGITNTLSKMGPAGLAAAGVFATVALGIAACITAGIKFATAVDSIAKRAKGIDMTAQAFFGLEGAVSKAGGDIERTTQIIQKLDDALQKAASGSKEAIDAFRSIGLSWADLKDMTPEDRLIAIVRRIRELKQEGKDVPSVFRSLLGRRGMNELNKLVADTQFEANLKSGGLSDEAVNNSEKLATSLTELKQNFVKMLSNNSTMITLVKMINNGVVAIAKHFGQNLNPNMNKDTENLTAVGAEFNRQYTSGNLNARTVQKNLSPEEMADLILTAFKGGTINPEDFENINFGTDKNKVQFKQFRSMFDLRDTELENFGKALRELAKTNPEALKESFLGFTHNLLYLEDEMGAQLAGAALGWKGVDAFDTGTWFKFKSSTPSKPSSPTNTQPSAPSSTAQSSGTAVDLDAKLYAQSNANTSKVLNDVGRYSDESAKKIFETFYNELMTSGTEAGEKAAENLIKELEAITAFETDPNKIKAKLEEKLAGLEGKIPDAIAEEHKKFIEDTIADLQYYREHEQKIKFEKWEEDQAKGMRSKWLESQGREGHLQNMLEQNRRAAYEAKGSPLTRDELKIADQMALMQDALDQFTSSFQNILNTAPGQDKIHTNELAEKGGFVGGVQVEHSAYEHNVVQALISLQSNVGAMNSRIQQMTRY